MNAEETKENRLINIGNEQIQEENTNKITIFG